MVLPRFAVLALAFLLARSASGAPYPDLLAAGDTLATEQSWEQAKLRYTEALAAAPDAEARAHCELLIEDSTWHSEASPSGRWRTGEQWQQRHLAVYDRLEQPYHEGEAKRAPDDFWQDVVTHRAKFEQFLTLPIAWKHYAAVAQQLGLQPSSPEAAHRYIAFLQGILSPPPSDLPPEFSHSAPTSSAVPKLLPPPTIALGAPGKSPASENSAPTATKTLSPTASTTAHVGLPRSPQPPALAGRRSSTLRNFFGVFPLAGLPPFPRTRLPTSLQFSPNCVKPASDWKVNPTPRH